MIRVMYAVSSHDMLALPPAMRELALGVLMTQRGERIVPLSGAHNEVRRAIYRAQAVAQVGNRFRFYVAYAPGLWDVAPSLKAIALMRV